jgi:hypothetical protein
MSIRYRLDCDCDRCGTILRGISDVDLGGGIKEKPVPQALQLDAKGDPIPVQPIPTEIEAWRVAVNTGELYLCTTCLIEAISGGEIWSAKQL